MSITQLMLLTGDLLVARDKYLTQHSLRFDGSADYLSRTQTTPTESRKWTWSGWVKLSTDSTAQQELLGSGPSNDQSHMQFISNRFGFRKYTNAEDISIYAQPTFTDTSVWNHFVIAYDSTEATASNRAKIWANGQPQSLTYYDGTTAATYPDLDEVMSLNKVGESHYIGRRAHSADYWFDGQLAEYHFIDGQALDPTYFGQTRGGVWLPKQVTGVTYGNNGFYLDFKGNDTGAVLLLDGSSTTDVTGLSTVTPSGSGYTTNNTTGAKFNQYIDLQNSGYFNVAFPSALGVSNEPFTVETWAYFDVIGNDGVFQLYQGSSKLDGTIVNHPDSIAVAVNSARWTFYEYSGVNSNLGTSATGNWYHVAVVYDGTNLAFYVDGVLLRIVTKSMPAGGWTSIGIGGYYTTTYLMDGRIEDFRVTKGYALYTTNFTPPTSALTNTPEYLGDFGVDRTTDGTGVTLLMDGSSATTDSSSANIASNLIAASGVTATDTTTLGISHPYGSSAVNILDFSNTQTGGISHTSSAITPLLDPEDTQWTLEMWVRPESFAVYDYLIAQATDGATGWSNGLEWILDWDTTNIYFVGYNGSGSNTTLLQANLSTYGITVNNWHHIAVVRDGSDTMLFLNGTKAATVTNQNAVKISGNRHLFIGTDPTDTYAFEGQMTDIRITRSVARYTDSFTPPTSALSADVSGITGSDDVVLKLNADNNLTDEAGRHTPTGAGVSYSTDVPFASGNSHSFSFSPTATNDVSEVITLPNSTDFQFGADPFTVEMWFKWDGTAGLQILFNTYEGTGVSGLAIAINGATLACYCTSDGANWFMTAASGGITFTANTWHHLAIVRYPNGYIEAFKDGVKGTSPLSTSTASIWADLQALHDAHIGGSSNYYAFNGLIDDVRITKGAALYPFHPPISALTNDDTWDKPKNNFSVEGNISADDQLLDTPNLRFANLDPSFRGGTTGEVLSEGNLKYYCPINNENYVAATDSKTSGKWYFETLYDGSTNNTGQGIVGWTYDDISQATSNGVNPADLDYGGMFSFFGWVIVDTASATAVLQAPSANDVIGVAFDADTQRIWFSVQGSWVEGNPDTGTLATSYGALTSGKTYIPFIGHYSNSSTRKTQAILNFGQDHTFAGEKPALLTPYSDANGVGEFYYQPPSGFLALAQKYS